MERKREGKDEERMGERKERRKGGGRRRGTEQGEQIINLSRRNILQMLISNGILEIFLY